jgi:hypothetical protein
MLAGLRVRLTYANVVATLALFVALGGSSYAITQIGSKQVKNRSLRGLDLRRNTLKGTEVNESRLGPVPNALHADTAGSAGSAALATDAQALGGQGPGAFEKSSRFQFGRAPQGPISVAGERVVLDYPAMGGQVRTAVNNGGCAGGTVGLRFVNLRTSGPQLRIYEDPLIGNLPPESDFIRCSTPNNTFKGKLADSAGETGLTLWFDCVSVDAELRCLGIRSEP